MNTLLRDRKALKRLVESYGKQDVLNFVRHLNENENKRWFKLNTYDFLAKQNKIDCAEFGEEDYEHMTLKDLLYYMQHDKDGAILWEDTFDEAKEAFYNYYRRTPQIIKKASNALNILSTCDTILEGPDCVYSAPVGDWIGRHENVDFICDEYEEDEDGTEYDFIVGIDKEENIIVFTGDYRSGDDTAFLLVGLNPKI